jgi:hypothetical protein
MADVYEKDENDIIKVVNSVKKNPVTIKPRLVDWCDWDIFVLMGKSWNKHHNDKVDIGDGFDDKRFEKYLGEDY